MNMIRLCVQSFAAFDELDTIFMEEAFCTLLYIIVG